MITIYCTIGLGILLASYSWGNSAKRLLPQKDDDLIEECLQQIAQIHQLSYNFVRLEFLSGAIKHWLEDEYSLAAFVFSRPYHV